MKTKLTIEQRLEIYKTRNYPDISKYLTGNKIDPLNSTMKIVIPTYQRENMADKLTYNRIPDDLKSLTYFISRESRTKLLKSKFPNANIISIKDDNENIALTRQRILELFPDNKVLMIDDLVILEQRDPNNKYYSPSHSCTDEQYHELYDWMSYLLDYVTAVGVNPRQGQNRNTDSMINFDTRLYGVYGLRTDIFNKENIRFDQLYQIDNRCSTLEDMSYNLQLLSKGYENILITDFINNSSHSAPGGCTESRTLERNNASWETLQSLYPNFIKLRVDSGKSWGGNFKNIDRYEGIVSWKKVLKSYTGQLPPCYDDTYTEN
jgi:hypothetical protein